MTLALPVLIATPITNASGIVAAMVNSPHGLSASAFTTTSPNTARMITMIASRLNSATNPITGFMSSRII